MSISIGPACWLNEVLGHTDQLGMLHLGHEWPKVVPAKAARVVKDASGTTLV